MAKLRPIDDRLATLVDDGDFEDDYRPEPSSPRAPRRVSNSRPASSTGDFADPADRAGPRSGRARAAMLQDGYDDGYEGGYEDERLFRHDDDDIDSGAATPRSRRRVAVARNAKRSGWLASKWGRIGLALALLAILGVLTSAFLLVRGFFLHDARFRVESASSIQLIGNSEISRAELLGVFNSDVGRNIFTVPLAQRRAALEQLPWVQSATVMRLLPNQLRAAIVERIPAAFVREGNRIGLVDATGIILSMPPSMLAARHYSFPVVAGINASDPPETRAERMQLYEKFVTELDNSATAPVPATAPKAPPRAYSIAAPKPSQQLSEVDVSDPEDVRALLPSAGTDILVHFGDQDFAARYRSYQQHLAQWRQQYPHLASVDLRYDRQTVLEMAKTAGSEASSGTTEKVDTTPTLAATPTAGAQAKPLATHITPAKKPALPPKQLVKPALKPAAKAVSTAPVTKTAHKPAIPAYTAPFDNPHSRPKAKVG